MTTPPELSELRLAELEGYPLNDSRAETLTALSAFYRANARVAAKPSEPVATGERLTEEDVLILTTFADSWSTELRGLTVDERRVRLRRYVAQCIQEAKPAIVKAACSKVWKPSGEIDKMTDYARGFVAGVDAVERSVKGG